MLHNQLDPVSPARPLASARVGATIVNAATGERVRWRATRESSSGRELRFDYWGEAGSVAAAPNHRHPRQSEHLTVTSGTAIVRLAASTVRLSAGDSLVLAPGTAHSLWPASGCELHLVAELRPALDMEGFLLRLFAAASTNPFRLASALRDHPAEIELARIPVIIQRAGLHMLAWLDRSHR